MMSEQGTHRFVWIRALLALWMLSVEGSAAGVAQTHAVTGSRSSTGPGAPQLEWQEPSQSWVGLGVGIPIRVVASDGAPVVVRVESGPATLQNGVMTVTNRGTVLVTASYAGPGVPSPVPLRRYFNPEDIVLPRGSWPGHSRATQGHGVQVVGDKVYVAGGYGGLVVLQRSPPFDTRRIGGADTPSYSLGVHVAGGNAYVADHEGGLQIFDVSKPETPVRVGALSSIGSAFGVFVTNHTAFVTARRDGLRLIDVSDPSRPVLVSTVATGGDALRVQVSGRYAYVTTGTAGLTVVDVADPASPQIVSSIGVGGVAVGVDVTGTVAYVAAYNAGLVTLDISSPAEPRVLGQYPAAGAYQTRVDGTTLYLVDSSAGLIVLDVVDPAQPRLRTSVRTTGGATDGWLAGEYFYVGTQVSCLDEWRIDASGGRIIEIAGLSTAIAVRDDEAYVADGSPGLVALGVGNPDEPVVRATWRTAGETEDVDLSGGYAYLANALGGILPLGVGEPSGISTNNTLQTLGNPNAIRIRGRYAYVADGRAGLSVLDLAQPEAPVLVTNIGVGGLARDLELQGSTAFVAVQDFGLRFVDISNPTSPRLMTTVGTQALGVGVSGDYAFLATGGAGIEVLNIRNPSQPHHLGFFDTPGAAVDVEIVGNLAFVSDFDQGLLVLDVLEPASPRILQTFRTPGHVYGFRAAGNTGYILDGEWGVQVVDLRIGTPQRLDIRIPTGLVTTNLPFTLSATASSGLPVTFRVMDGEARISGDQLLEGSRGVVTVRVEQAGDERTLAVSEDVNITMSLPGQSIRWEAPGGLELPVGTSIELVAIADTGLPITYTVAGGPAVLEGNRLTVTNRGPVSVVAQQAGTDRYAAATHTRRFNLEETDLTQVARWPEVAGGSTTAVRWVGRYAYVGAGPLRIYDMVDPQQPVSVAVLEQFSSVAALELQGSLMGVVDRQSRVSFLDVSDPARPVVLGEYRSRITRITDVFLEGGFAYLIGSVEMQVLDIRDPAKPVRVSSLFGPSVFQAIHVAEGLAYVAAQATGVVVYDVKDPARPELLSQFQIDGFTMDVTVRDGLAYVANSVGGLQILDVSDPAKLSRIGRFNTPGDAARVQWVDGWVYVADGVGGVQVIDVAKPSAPVRLGSFRGVGVALDARVNGDVVLIAEDSAGLEVAKILGPGVLSQASLQLTRVSTRKVRVSGEHAFAVDRVLGLMCLDVRNASRTLLTGSLPTVGVPSALWVEDAVAYIGSDVLEIVDLGDPSNPVSIGEVFTRSEVKDVVVREGRAYAATARTGLVVVDVSNASDPRVLVNVPYPSPIRFATALAVHGRYAYLASGVSTSDRIEVLDLDDPVSPRWVGEWTGGTDLTALVVSGGYLFVADGASGFKVMDLSDPVRPRQIGQGGGGWTARGIDVGDGLAVVAVGNSGVQIFDVTDPRLPVRIGSVRPSGISEGVAIRGDTVFVAAQEGGLQGYRMARGRRQVLDFDPPSTLVPTEAILLESKASSGLPVVFELVSGPATLSGNRLVASGSGSVVVRAAQLGDEFRLPVYLERTIEVRRMPQEISWSFPGEAVLNAHDRHPITVRADSGLPVSLRVRSGPAVLVDGSLTITNDGPVVLAAVQAGDALHAPVEQERAFNTLQPDIRELAAWPRTPRGAISGVAASAGHAYLAGGAGGLIVADVKQPFSTSLVGSQTFGAGINDAGSVLVAGGYAYVGDHRGVVGIFDLANADAPVWVGEVSAGGRILGMDIDGGHLFVNPLRGNLQVVDIRDPRSPRVVAQIPGVPAAGGMAVSAGVMLLAMGSSGVAVFDVHDPEHPLRLPDFNPGAFNVVNVDLENSLAVMGLSTDGFAMVDLSDPGVPRLLRRYSNLGASVVRLRDQVVYLRRSREFLVVDISRLESPQVTSVALPGDAQERPFDIDGGFAYVALGEAGMAIVDLGRPGGPAITTRVPTYASTSDISVSGGVAHAAQVGPFGLEILDVADRANPKSIVQIAPDMQGYAVARSGNSLFLGTSDKGVRVFDAADPLRPFAMGSVSNRLGFPRIHAASNLLFVATGTPGWEVFDASNLRSPKLLGGSVVGSTAYSMVTTGAVAYVAAGEGGLKVFDITQPESPLLLASLPLSGDAREVVVRDGLAYVAGDRVGLQIVNVTVPGLPEILGSLVIGGRPLAMDVAHGVACVGGGDGQVSVVDVRDARAPVLVGTYFVGGRVRSIRLVDEVAFVACSEAGLHILNIGARLPQFIAADLPAEISSPTEILRLKATATSGLPVEYSLIEGPAVLEADTLRFQNAGVVRLRIRQSGSDRYREVVSEREIRVGSFSMESTVRSWIERAYPEIPEEARLPGGDPDGDGVPNVLEYLLATHPGRADPGDGRMPLGRLLTGSQSPVWEITVPIDEERAAVPGWRFETTGHLPSDVWEAVPSSMVRRSATSLVISMPVTTAETFIRLRIVPGF